MVIGKGVIINQPCASFECDVGGPSWSAWVSKLKIGCRYGDTLPILWYLEVSDTKKDLRNAFFSEFYEDLCLADFFFKVTFELSLLQMPSNDVEQRIWRTPATGPLSGTSHLRVSSESSYSTFLDIWFLMKKKRTPANLLFKMILNLSQTAIMCSNRMYYLWR